MTEWKWTSETMKRDGVVGTHISGPGIGYWEPAHLDVIHAELRKGILPCRFCGLDWFWDGNRHDPLRMAGVSTMIGAQRHWSRIMTVGWHRLLRRVVLQFEEETP